MKNAARLIVFVLLVFVSGELFADGAGGVFFGYQMSRYPFLDNYPVENNNLGLAYYGAGGYGVSYFMARLFTGLAYKPSDYLNSIAGGFGFAIMDAENPGNIAGGFGGVIAGIRIFKTPLNISVISYTGFGGIGTGSFSYDGHRGFFCISEEVTLEVGLPLLGWFMPTVYVGYQLIGNAIPGRIFRTFISYTPVAGVRAQFGDFH